MKNIIQNAYRQLGKEASFYDGMMTCSTVLGTAVSKLVWGIGKEKNEAYIEKALSGIPADFAGKLLEVPVGTGVLTVPVYRTLPNADITCLDYSESMMAAAQEKAQMLGISNITFRQGDVGKLPFPDESFDIVLSMNGFHAFPDKEAAYRETFRVLKKGGIFCGCFYIAGENSRTDWFIDHLYVPKGFFTPPFEIRESLLKCLSEMYTEVSIETVESEGCFLCRK